VPFVAVTGLYKLTPTFERSQVPLSSPGEVLPFEEVAELEHVHVDNPVIDYLPQSLVSLLLTNFGGYNPSYIYRLLREWYDVDDMAL
jgi:translation initiation factor eIF-2B subunit beta